MQGQILSGLGNTDQNTIQAVENQLLNLPFEAQIGILVGNLTTPTAQQLGLGAEQAQVMPNLLFVKTNLMQGGYSEQQWNNLMRRLPAYPEFVRFIASKQAQSRGVSGLGFTTPTMSQATLSQMEQARQEEERQKRNALFSNIANNVTAIATADTTTKTAQATAETERLRLEREKLRAGITADTNGTTGGGGEKDKNKILGIDKTTFYVSAGVLLLLGSIVVYSVASSPSPAAQVQTTTKPRSLAGLQKLNKGNVQREVKKGKVRYAI